MLFKRNDEFFFFVYAFGHSAYISSARHQTLDRAEMWSIKFNSLSQAFHTWEHYNVSSVWHENTSPGGMWILISDKCTIKINFHVILDRAHLVYKMHKITPVSSTICRSIGVYLLWHLFDVGKRFCWLIKQPIWLNITNTSGGVQTDKQQPKKKN